MPSLVQLRPESVFGSLALYAPNLKAIRVAVLESMGWHFRDRHENSLLRTQPHWMKNRVRIRIRDQTSNLGSATDSSLPLKDELFRGDTNGPLRQCVRRWSLNGEANYSIEHRLMHHLYVLCPSDST